MSDNEQVGYLIKQFNGKRNNVIIPMVYIKMLGDLNAAAVLAQIIYWTEKKDEGWFYKSYPEWEAETGLSQYQIKRAVDGDKRTKAKAEKSKKNPRATLRDLGIKTDLRRAENGKTCLHYTIDFNVFVPILEVFIETGEMNIVHNTDMNNVDNAEINNVHNGLSTMLITGHQQCSQPYTKNTTKTTTETTDKEKPSPLAKEASGIAPELEPATTEPLPFSGEPNPDIEPAQPQEPASVVAASASRELPSVDPREVDATIYAVGEPSPEAVKGEPTAKQINSMIAAWWTTLVAKPVSTKNPYQIPAYREYAGTLIDQGVTPDHVQRYVRELQEQAFWRDKSVKWKYVADNIGTWMKKNPIVIIHGEPDESKMTADEREAYRQSLLIQEYARRERGMDVA